MTAIGGGSTWMTSNNNPAVIGSLELFCLRASSQHKSSFGVANRSLLKGGIGLSTILGVGSLLGAYLDRKGVPSAQALRGALGKHSWVVGMALGLGLGISLWFIKRCGDRYSTRAIQDRLIHSCLAREEPGLPLLRLISRIDKDANPSFYATLWGQLPRAIRELKAVQGKEGVTADLELVLSALDFLARKENPLLLDVERLRHMLERHEDRAARPVWRHLYECQLPGPGVPVSDDQPSRERDARLAIRYAQSTNTGY